MVGQPAASSRLSRSHSMRLSMGLPLFGTVIGHASVTYDDVEKTLQVFGLVGTLALSCVVSTLGSGHDLAELPRGESICSLYWFASQFYAMQVCLVIMTYIYTTSLIEQESHSPEENNVMREWWKIGGRVTFTILILLFFGATFLYLRGVLWMLQDRCHGDFIPTGVRLTVYLVFVALVVMTHLGFVPAMRARERCKQTKLKGEGGADAMHLSMGLSPHGSASALSMIS